MTSNSIQAFRARLHGTVLCPDDDGYDASRRVFNGMIDKRPAVIARCADAQDVINAVDFGCTRGLLTALRGGGHSVAGNSSCDGGLVIDLSTMKHIEVDAGNRRARAEPGVLLGELDRMTQESGLATPLGIVSNTGIAGLTLGGGIGWLLGRYGLTCDNLLSAQVVTATGELIMASPTEHPDLLWALRGGGGNFGVVTCFEYQLHPVNTVLGGVLIYEMPRASQVLRAFREFAESCPDELSMIVRFWTGPDGTPLVAIDICHCGRPPEAEVAAKALRSIARPLADLVRPMPYLKMQSLFDEDLGVPRRLQYWKSTFLSELGDDAIDTMIAFLTRAPSPLTVVDLTHVHGAATRVGTRDTAFAHRTSSYLMGIYARWTGAGETAANIAWAREFWETMRPFAGGGLYVNNMSYEGEDLARVAYGANYDRLVSVKNRYDPANFFRLNLNIRPTRQQPR